MTIKFAKDGKTFSEPFRPQHLRTRAGGTVLEVTGCGHTLDKPANGFSRDDWFHTCRVTYEDDDRVYTHDYHPSQIIYVGEHNGPGHAEACELSEAMNDYLARHGQWRDSKIRGWVANRDDATTKRRRA